MTTNFLFIPIMQKLLQVWSHMLFSIDILWIWKAEEKVKVSKFICIFVRRRRIFIFHIFFATYCLHTYWKAWKSWVCEWCHVLIFWKVLVFKFYKRIIDMVLCVKLLSFKLLSFKIFVIEKFVIKISNFCAWSFKAFELFEFLTLAQKLLCFRF